MKKEVLDILKEKKYQWVAVAIVLFVILSLGVWIRTQNLDLLVDKTTGEYIPLALDPFYFLRVAETIYEQGGLPEYDYFRNPALETAWHPEILPDVVVAMTRVANVFGNFSIQYIDVISPVVFFVFGLIIFFFLVYVLTKSKIAAGISSVFLAFVPAYLYRTMAGFSDHEAIGMVAFFSLLLVFALALKYLDRKKVSWKGAVLWSLGVGLASAFTIASWGGIAKFTYMILPLTFFIFWIFKREKISEKYLISYFIIFFSGFLFSSLFGYSVFSTIKSFGFNTSNSIVFLFVSAFLIIDYLMLRFGKKLIKGKEKYRVFFSLAVSVVVGFIGLGILGKMPWEVFSSLWHRVIYPSGTTRVGLTVAENAQPFLVDWISQTGTILFWLFFAGLIFVGFDLVKTLKGRKNKVYLFGAWVLLVCGFLFSRISSNAFFNGTNFFSVVFYAGSLALFGFVFFWIYSKEEFSWSPELSLIVSWMFFMLLAARGSARFLFLVTPFACFMAGYCFYKVFSYFNNYEKKDSLMKLFLVIGGIVLILSATFSFYSLYNQSLNQARYTGPSANGQWQEAMGWVRNNTQEDAIFSHWWDYGYWVQTLGERASILDGGHPYAGANHLMGRYVLTTPNPETAFSFLKTNNVTHLLIDQTDVGKYSAFSKIGSGEEGLDRYSWIPVVPADDRQTQEKNDSVVRVYPTGTPIDEDIVYFDGSKKILLPRQKAALIGIIIERLNDGSFSQPKGAYVYNNQQYLIPMRYLYFNGGHYDFGEGLNATARILPSIVQTQKGTSIDSLGAVMYLSPKVSEGLFAQVYLLNDPKDLYPTIKLVHSEDSGVVSSLKSQGAQVGPMVYYRGFRGPINIYEVNYPAQTETHEEFFSGDFEWAKLDYLF